MDKDTSIRPDIFGPNVFNDFVMRKGYRGYLKIKETII